MTQRKAVLVMGAGDATGGAIARRFAREGYVACVARRNAEKLEPLVQAIRDQGGEALACGCDARQEQQVIDLFARIEGEVGALEAVIFNVGANVWFPITETTERVYRKVWEMAAFGGFLTGREAARVMLPRQRGTIIFTGATASLRGRAHFAAFSGAKFALRALAQSMARELGPKGIHVAHPIIDGAIDTDFIREPCPSCTSARSRTASSIPSTSPRPTGRSTASRATAGCTNWTCAPGWKPSDPRHGKSHA